MTSTRHLGRRAPRRRNHKNTRELKGDNCNISILISGYDVKREGAPSRAAGLRAKPVAETCSSLARLLHRVPSWRGTPWARIRNAGSSREKAVAECKCVGGIGGATGDGLRVDRFVWPIMYLLLLRLTHASESREARGDSLPKEALGTLHFSCRQETEDWR